MRRTCERCQAEFDAPTSRARFCADRCRKAFGKHGPIRPLPALTLAPPAAEDGAVMVDAGPLSTVTLRDLRAVGEDGSVRGLLALTLARAIDGGNYTGAGLTALSREFARLWSDIHASRTVVADTPLDVARRKRNARR